MRKTLNRVEFFKKFNITEEAFEQTKLSWDELLEIYDHYTNDLPNLETAASTVFNTLMKESDVHSVRYRLKDAEKVIEKIIRKKNDNPERTFTVHNYQEELTDLIGIRVLHLFKEQWPQIHKRIQDLWDLKESPILYHRTGDLFSSIVQNCIYQEHEFGYRSAHYVVKFHPTKKTCYAEIQVRTIFEEAWSEINHKFCYPNDQDNIIFVPLLTILNRFAGGADEIGSFILLLKEQVKRTEEENNRKLQKQRTEQNAIIKQLKAELRKSNLSKVEKRSFTESIDQLATSVSILPEPPKPPTTNMSSSLTSLLNSLSGNNYSISQMLNDALVQPKSAANALLSFSDSINESLKSFRNPLAIGGVTQEALSNALKGLNIEPKDFCRVCGSTFIKVNKTDDNICEKCRKSIPK